MALALTAIGGLLTGWAIRAVADDAIIRHRRRRYLDDLDGTLMTRDELELSWERQSSRGQRG
jgi:hypothetical protein